MYNATNITPFHLFRLLLHLQINRVRIPDSIKTIKSNNAVFIPKATLWETFKGEIEEDKPMINMILKIFDPITFPTAISFSFLIEATTLVTSSGRLVPTATIVKPIISSYTPNILAASIAPFTNKSEPYIIAARPTHVTKTTIPQFLFARGLIASSDGSLSFEFL